jgi:hypothetical protein
MRKIENRVAFFVEKKCKKVAPKCESNVLRDQVSNN